MYGEPDDDLDGFIAEVDRALTRQFGPNHQAILSGGRTIAAFDWQAPPPLTRLPDS